MDLNPVAVMVCCGGATTFVFTSSRRFALAASASLLVPNYRAP
ncbi:MAG: hypothetical protein WCW53_14780 [Syntrophales bacterium]